MMLGFDKPAIDYFIRSGKLVSIGHAVYRKPGPPLKWEHLVYSLVELGYNVHVGGRSSLDLSGFAHHLPLGGTKSLHVYYTETIPTWVNKVGIPVDIVTDKLKLISTLPEAAITHRPFGHWDWSIPYASPELALLELLDTIDGFESFQAVDKYFEIATTLRPELLSQLLSACKKVQVNRIFLWFAKRHNLPCYKALKISDINLGSGKRMIARGGVLDKEFQITVPKEMASDAQSDFL